jgi:hypothetical protein
MKTKILLFIVSSSMMLVQAQIPNNSFEDNNQCNLSANWSYLPLQAVIIDSSGNPITDSIIWDAGVNALNIPVSDAHTGSQAMSLRNAYSYNSGQKYIGISMLYPDSSECVAFFQNLLPINYGPQDFSFYYKYAPLNGDTAYAIAALYDQWGMQIAVAEQWLIGSQSTYVQNVTPFIYYSSDSVAYYSINFYNMIPDGYPHQSTFGTRLTIDDVSFQGNMGLTDSEEDINVSVFPNPASENFTIMSSVNTSILKVSVINIHGQSISLPINGSLKFDCSTLAPGIYQIKIDTNNGTTYKKFIKE